MRLSLRELRRYLVAYQGLDERRDPERLLDGFFGRVGSIQYDPLNVVGRNADLVLRARFKGFKRGMLESWLYEERRLVDGWDKMMSIYALGDWPRLRRLREWKKREVASTLAARRALHALDKAEAVLRHLGEKGASRPGAIELGSVERDGWGHARQSSVALDYLFNIGLVGVSRKVNTQKVYDRIENLIPPELLEQGDGFEGDRDFHRWFVLRRIGSVGALWNRNSVLWLGLGPELKNRSYRSALISELRDEGRLVELGVEGIEEPFFIRTGDLQLLEALGGGDRARAGALEGARAGARKATARFLAPLDNLLWDRDLVEAVFGFNYRWEVYTPAAKRRFGYYVLPILYGDELVGRIEPSVDAEGKRLQVKGLWLEQGRRLTKALSSAIATELRGLANFLGLEGADFPSA